MINVIGYAPSVSLESLIREEILEASKDGRSVWVDRNCEINPSIENAIKGEIKDEIEEQIKRSACVNSEVKRFSKDPNRKWGFVEKTHNIFDDKLIRSYVESGKSVDEFLSEYEENAIKSIRRVKANRDWPELGVKNGEYKPPTERDLNIISSELEEYRVVLPQVGKVTRECEEKLRNVNINASVFVGDVRDFNYQELKKDDLVIIEYSSYLNRHIANLDSEYLTCEAAYLHQDARVAELLCKKIAPATGLILCRLNKSSINTENRSRTALLGSVGMSYSADRVRIIHSRSEIEGREDPCSPRMVINIEKHKK